MVEQDAIPGLIADLKSGEDDRAEAAVYALASQGSRAVTALRELIAGQDGKSAAEVDARWWAVRALAEIPGPETSQALRTALTDPEASVRQGAALGLRSQPDPSCTSDLIAALDDSDPLTAQIAGDALIALGSQAVPALIDTLENGSTASRLGAARALALIGDPQAIPALFRCLDSDSMVLEHWVSEGLDRMGVGMAFFKP